MEIILIFIRHYLFCLIGAIFRYIFNNIINILKKQPFLSFSIFWNYKTNPENELKDAFVGFLFLGILLSILI